jgi:hypothetical protein
MSLEEDEGMSDDLNIHSTTGRLDAHATGGRWSDDPTEVDCAHCAVLAAGAPSALLAALERAELAAEAGIAQLQEEVTRLRALKGQLTGLSAPLAAQNASSVPVTPVTPQGFLDGLRDFSADQRRMSEPPADWGYKPHPY